MQWHHSHAICSLDTGWCDLFAAWAPDISAAHLCSFMTASYMIVTLADGHTLVLFATTIGAHFAMMTTRTDKVKILPADVVADVKNGSGLKKKKEKKKKKCAVNLPRRGGNMDRKVGVSDTLSCYPDSK